MRRDPADKILSRIHNGVIAAVGPSVCRFFVRSDRADHRGADRLEPLAGNQANAAGRGVEQHRVAGLHLVRAPDQVLHGHALEHHRRRGLVSDAVGELQQPVRRHDAYFRVRTRRSAGVGNAIAYPDMRS